MRRNDIKRWLRDYQESKIHITSHLKTDRAYRGIKEEIVKNNILHPENLIRVSEECHDKLGEYKFKLRFKISRSKSIGVVVILNEVLKVITAYIINEKWEKLWKKRLK